MATSLGGICQSGKRQYDQLASGFPDLQPEKSKQATLGIRFEPSTSVSLGADLWTVKITDSFGQKTEQLVFANPSAFPNSWTTQRNIGTGKNYLAFVASNENLGDSYSTGLDIDFSARTKTSMGLLSSQLTLTYMLKEKSQLVKGGEFYSAIGNFAELGTVTFRTKGRVATSLDTGNFTHTLGVNFQSGYKDQETTVELLDATGNVAGTEDIRIDVKRYFTFDWQTVWSPKGQKWSITAGVLNLTDKAPPFVVSSGGSTRGQQVGYDDRYYDSRGRTFYVNGTYKF